MYCEHNVILQDEYGYCCNVCGERLKVTVMSWEEFERIKKEIDEEKRG